MFHLSYNLNTFLSISLYKNLTKIINLIITPMHLENFLKPVLSLAYKHLSWRVLSSPLSLEFLLIAIFKYFCIHIIKDTII